jgi:ribonuclease HII
MVMVGLKCSEEDEERLRRMGVKDSKLLSPLQRERLYEQLIEHFEYELIILTPKEIDEALAHPDLNLNWLEALTTAKLLNLLNADKAYVDCPSNNVEAYTAYLKKHLEVKTIIVCEHGADKTYPVASAASIIAKVTRDKAIRDIEKRIGQRVGSGYPSDPVTVQFLKENWNKHKEIFRTSWASYKNIAQKHAQKGLEDF